MVTGPVTVAVEVVVLEVKGSSVVNAVVIPVASVVIEPEVVVALGVVVVALGVVVAVASPLSFPLLLDGFGEEDLVDDDLDAHGGLHGRGTRGFCLRKGGREEGRDAGRQGGREGLLQLLLSSLLLVPVLGDEGGLDTC